MQQLNQFSATLGGIDEDGEGEGGKAVVMGVMGWWTRMQLTQSKQPLQRFYFRRRRGSGLSGAAGAAGCQSPACGDDWVWPGAAATQGHPPSLDHGPSRYVWGGRVIGGSN